MTGMAAKVRMAAAVAVAALLTALVFVSVHPDRLTSWAGVVPLAATLWATFAVRGAAGPPHPGPLERRR